MSGVLIPDAGQRVCLPCCDPAVAFPLSGGLGYGGRGVRLLAAFRNTRCPHLHICNTLYNRDPAANYVSPEAYENYLKNNHHNESRFVYPIKEGAWIDEEMPEHVAEAGMLVLRGHSIEVPSPESYAQHGIPLGGDRPAIFELCRFLAAVRRDDVLATPDERAISVLPEMRQILQLEEWHHPDVVAEELPSQVDSF